MKKRIFLGISIVMIFMLLLSGCNTKENVNSYEKNNKEEFKSTDLKNGKYLLSFSGGGKVKSLNSFSIIYEDGKVKEFPVNKSIVIENAIKDQDELLFFSRQKNTHFSITNDSINDVSFLEELYGDAYVGVLFATKDNEYFFTGMNVGFSDKGYISELLYKHKDETEYTNLTLYDKIICSAVYNNNTIYVQYLDLNKKDDNSFFRTAGIIEVNKETQEVIKETFLDSKYEGEPDRPLVLFGDDLIIYRAEIDEEAIPTGKSHMAVYSNGNIINERELSEFIIYKAYSHNDRLYLVDIYGSVLTYDLDYNLIDSYKLKSFDGFIRSAYFSNNELYVALISEDKTMVINHYDLSDGGLIETDKVVKPTVIEWNNESFTFLPLE